MRLNTYFFEDHGFSEPEPIKKVGWPGIELSTVAGLK
jgi:hypothetical protein